jgi:uncharacterized membrane protein YdbT with pleckstrin-like domain
MGYIDAILQPDEKVLAIGHMHWIVYLRGLVLALIAAIFLLWPADSVLRLILLVAGAIIALYAIISLLQSWIEKWTTEIAVTNRRVIHKRGLIRRETGEMNMDKVESVVVDQTILGRILGYGSIVVRGTGAGIEGLHHIANPLALRSTIVVR